MVVVSPMAAALIYSTVPPAGAFAAVALLNFAAFVLQRCIRPKYETAKNPEVGKPSVWSDFLQGVCYVKQDRFLRVFVMVLPVVNVFFHATFAVSVMYLLRESFQLSAYAYGVYCTVTASMSLIVPLFAVPIVNKFSTQRIFSVSTSLIAAKILGIAVLALFGVNGYLPVMVSVVFITVLDCMTIAEAIPMQMAASVLLQTGTKKELLGRVSSVIKMASTAGVALGNLLFGILNDLTVVWIPILLGAAGVACASFLYQKMLRNH